MARYVLRLEPLASATPASLVAAIGPNVQHYLTGDVELPVRALTRVASTAHQDSGGVSTGSRSPGGRREDP